MNDKYTDKQLKKKHGMRPVGTPIDFPQELGYRCPKGHADLQWSEFKEHIWCYKCKKDFYYGDCLIVKDESNPTFTPGIHDQPRIIIGIDNWTKDGNSFNDVPPEVLDENEVK